MTEEQTYIPLGHLPHANSIKNLYVEANVDLLTPHPSVKLKHYPRINALTGGFRVREFTILCGATGTGKTTLCANISRDLIEQGIPHFVASVETGHLDFIKRVMSVMAGKDLNTGDPVPLSELKHFHANHSNFFQTESCFLSLYENRMSVETLMADVAWMVKHRGIKLAMIDNLNFFLEVTKSADQIVEMDRVIHELIIFCKRVDVHLIMVMHPKKTISGRVDNEFDIKGSSTAVQESHNILLFNRPHPELIENGVATDGDREIMICKMRRKGKFVRKRLILSTRDGVLYREGEIV